MIIKPKYSGNFYTYILIGMMFLLCEFLYLYFIISNRNDTFKIFFGLLPMVFCFLYTLIVSGLIVRNLELKNIDTNRKTITIRPFPFLFKRNYRFDELEGYATGRLRDIIRGDDRLNKFVMILKDNRVLVLMDERHIKNITEIESSLKELKFLGYRSLSKFKRWQLIIFRIE